MIDTTFDVLWSVHPIARKQFGDLTQYLKRSYENGDTHSLFKPQKGFRTPAEQQILLNKRPAVTHAGPWQSAHNYGLAVDFVAEVRGAWSWSEDHDWAFLKKAAETFSLQAPLDWDKCHIQHPVFKALSMILKI